MSKASNLVIDSHQHFWKYDPVTYSWIDETMKLIQKDFLPGDLQPILEAHGVGGCVAVQADQSEEETRFLLDLAGRNSFIKGVVGWVDLSAPNIRTSLEIFTKDSKLKGVRHTVYDNKGEFMLQPDFQRGISLLKDFSLTYDILVFDYQLPGAIELAKTFPEQPFVLDHLGKPQISNGISKEWMQNIQKLADCKNVFCKISGLLSQTNDPNWKPEDFKIFIETVIKLFGSERLMFGSDWPVCLCNASYGDTLNIVKKAIDKEGEEVQKNIMGRNAVTFYKLKV